MQYVSSTPATRLDVVNLQEQLDHQLQSRQARETGICPVREELYSQCFGRIFFVEMAFQLLCDQMNLFDKSPSIVLSEVCCC